MLFYSCLTPRKYIIVQEGCNRIDQLHREAHKESEDEYYFRDGDIWVLNISNRSCDSDNRDILTGTNSLENP